MNTTPSIGLFDRAKERIGLWLRAIQESHTARGPQCGRGRAGYQSQDNPNKFKHVVFDCGRDSCRHCRGRRLVETAHRATSPILHVSKDTAEPRAEKIHVRRIAWSMWPTLCRWFSRNCGKAGRLHVREADGRCLVVAEVPFKGSRPLAPGNATLAALRSVGRLASVKHAFRLMGRWVDAAKQKAESWARITARLDEAVVWALAEEYGAKVKRLACGKVGIGIAFAENTPAKTLEDFKARLAAESKCPRLHKGTTGSSTVQTRTSSRNQSTAPATKSRPVEYPEAGPPRHDKVTAA